MTQFTASEMRAEAHRHANEVEDMLNAAADLIEAREKAVPYGYVSGSPIRENAGSLIVSIPEADFKTPVYIHPAFLFRG